MPVYNCIGCHAIAPESYDNNEGPYVCRYCHYKYPPALLKASCDPFLYAVCIEGMGTIQFENATLHGDWVTLYPSSDADGFHSSDSGPTRLPFSCPRGINIPLGRIIWVADAPNGS